MDPKVWGQTLWESLIYIAQGYPEQPTPEDQNSYQQFFVSLGPVLPCPACKINYLNHFQRAPIRLSNRQALLQWLHQIYNLTLQEQDRSPISYEYFLRKHVRGTSWFSQLSHWAQSNPLLTLLIIALIAFAIYYYQKRRNPFYY